MSEPDERHPYVVVSEIAVDLEGADALAAAFRDRLREVERTPGFGGLEVWRSNRESGRFMMVSRWTCRRAFAAYLRSDAHLRSHARVDVGPHGPRPVALDTFTIVAR